MCLPGPLWIPPLTPALLSPMPLPRRERKRESVRERVLQLVILTGHFTAAKAWDSLGQGPRVLCWVPAMLLLGCGKIINMEGWLGIWGRRNLSVRGGEVRVWGGRGETCHSLTPLPQSCFPWLGGNKKVCHNLSKLMTQLHTSTQGLEDTLTYVELVNSFIIAEIRIPALPKWSGLRGSWEGICNLVRSIAGWLGTAFYTQLLGMSFSFLSFPFLAPSHLFELLCLLCDPWLWNCV